MVNIYDLLAVINHWGSCSTPNTDPTPTTIEECHDACWERYPDNEEAYIQCMQACIESLCLQQLIECD